MYTRVQFQCWIFLNNVISYCAIFVYIIIVYNMRTRGIRMNTACMICTHGVLYAMVYNWLYMHTMIARINPHKAGALKVRTAVKNSDRQRIPSGPPMSAMSVLTKRRGGVHRGTWTPRVSGKFVNVDPGRKGLSTPYGMKCSQWIRIWILCSDCRPFPVSASQRGGAVRASGGGGSVSQWGRGFN